MMKALHSSQMIWRRAAVREKIFPPKKNFINHWSIICLKNSLAYLPQFQHETFKASNSVHIFTRFSWWLFYPLLDTVEASRPLSPDLLNYRRFLLERLGVYVPTRWRNRNGIKGTKRVYHQTKRSYVCQILLLIVLRLDLVNPADRKTNSNKEFIFQGFLVNLRVIWNHFGENIPPIKTYRYHKDSCNTPIPFICIPISIISYEFLFKISIPLPTSL